MIFPFESLSDERRALGLAIGVVIGIAFGFVLERSGFGRAQKLVGQFYLTDMTVLKVMFTAIVTAMLGSVILSRLGLLNLKAVYVYYPTYLWPMIVGGLMLGVGFVTSGYCPGTSWVASASGKLDGIGTVLGVMVGGLAYAEVQPHLGGFNDSGKRGQFFLSDVLHLPPAVVAALVALLAIGAFLGAEKLERLAGQHSDTPTRSRKWVFTGVVALAVVAVATLALPAGSALAH